MIKVVCSVFDVKAAVFAHPFYSPNTAVAVRDFRHACIDPQSALFRNPEDFQLFQVATFDDESGLFVPNVPPVFLENAGYKKDFVSSPYPFKESPNTPDLPL